MGKYYYALVEVINCYGKRVRSYHSPSVCGDIPPSPGPSSPVSAVGDCVVPLARVQTAACDAHV